MEYLGFLAVLVFLIILLLSGVRIAFAMMIVGIVLLYMEKGGALLDMTSWTAWRCTNSFVMTAIPLFVLMGEFLIRGGLAEDLYKAVTSWLFWLPGRCLQSNIMACTIFAAISGSSAASAATFGKIAIPPQRYLKYSSRHI